MNKKAFVIFTTLMMVLITFGATSVNSQEDNCINLYGTVRGTYCTDLPCDLQRTVLKGVDLTVESKVSGHQYTVTTSTGGPLGIIFPPGTYSVPVYENLEYRITLEHIQIIDDTTYKFEGDTGWFKVGTEDYRMDIEIHGSIVNDNAKIWGFSSILYLKALLQNRFEKILQALIA